MSTVEELSIVKENIPIEAVNVQTVTTMQSANQQPAIVITEQQTGTIPIDNGQTRMNLMALQPQTVRVVQQQTTVASTAASPGQNGYLVHSNYGVPMNAPPMDLIVPVQSSNIMYSKPKFNLNMGRPADAYQTRTNIDENLVEVIDDDSHR